MIRRISSEGKKRLNTIFFMVGGVVHIFTLLKTVLLNVFLQKVFLQKVFLQKVRIRSFIAIMLKCVVVFLLEIILRRVFPSEGFFQYDNRA